MQCDNFLNSLPTHPPLIRTLFGKFASTRTVLDSKSDSENPSKASKRILNHTPTNVLKTT